MHLISLSSLFVSATALASLSFAAPLVNGKDKRSFVERDGVNYTVFEHAATGAKLEFVKNSGICETTAGVNQYSGYLSVGTNMNMWFWFFEARSNPTTAPLAAWFNGGPGCSSMIGLFQENGPCHFVNGASTPSLNPYSWNTYANMIYIDQPIGVGFSYGTDSVTSTVTAAPYVWKLLQAFYAQFPQYENRDFGLFTESYGGHYGPEFAHYFQQQNAAIDAGTVTGQKIPIVALGINNGWFDPAIQEKAYIQFSYNNTYQSLISKSDYDSYMSTYESDCLPAIQACASSGSNSDCSNADNTCYNEIEGPLSQVADFDVYDIREPSNDPYPPSTYSTYLTKSSVVKAIGAKSTYQECPNAPYNKFATTGDDARSFLDTLSAVVSTGLTTLIWAGDADWICNWFGGLAVANKIQYSGTSQFASAALAPYNVNGAEGGTFKTVDNLSFLRVFGAGHEVPYYQPELALQAFKQTMMKGPISST
ncbi:putative carboxypeptidase S1 [Lepidopterella palustris CBS 459.81]|uniref:Carboxypeptidase n=1 Tax=Lepidopterella palustris CBS 459.81 TaxID=1314670 RepID=A0A8E2DWY0_9PEZI|nr:putative carboxypeptidase S1 [Lepidopterella palustris CBS 459.81]